MASENLKKVVLVITKGLKTADSVFDDGYQFADFFAFIPELSAIPEIVKNKEQLGIELKALKTDAVARKELVTYIETELVLENKKAERLTEIAFEIALLVFEGIALINEPKPETPQP